MIPLAGIWRDERFPDDVEQAKLQALSDAIDAAAGLRRRRPRARSSTPPPPGACRRPSSTAASASCCARCCRPTSTACPHGVSPIGRYADDETLDAVHVAWAGPTEPGAPHYYRLQGPRLLIEWDNTQRGGQPRPLGVARPDGRLRARRPRPRTGPRTTADGPGAGGGHADDRIRPTRTGQQTGRSPGQPLGGPAEPGPPLASGVADRTDAGRPRGHMTSDHASAPAAAAPRPVRVGDTTPEQERRLAHLWATAHEGAGDVPAALTLARDHGTHLPRPGTGSTAFLWSALATVAAADLTVARVLEPHLDAHAILEQAGERPGDGTWGVFAAEGPGEPLRATPSGSSYVLDGRKHWCSLGGVLDHALVSARVGQERQLFAVDLDHPGVTRRARDLGGARAHGGRLRPPRHGRRRRPSRGGAGVVPRPARLRVGRHRRRRGLVRRRGGRRATPGDGASDAAASPTRWHSCTSAPSTRGSTPPGAC